MTRSPLRGIASKVLRRSLAVLVTLPVATAAQAPGDPDELSAEELVFVLEYVSIDYGLAVTGGEIADAFEYREMQAFARLLTDRFDALRERGAPEGLRTRLGELRTLIDNVAPVELVRTVATGLTHDILNELDVASLPAVTPDVARGHDLFAVHCAKCHGATGAGDGPSAATLDPPPRSFVDARANLLTPHQIRGAVMFGVEGTGMSSFREALTSEEIWDVAFFVPTLREGFDPRPPPEALPFSLAELATRSNEDLLALARQVWGRVEPAHVDHYRANPPEHDGPGRLLARAEAAAAAAAAPAAAPAAALAPAPSGPASTASPGAPVDPALRLQEAFAAVAESVFPSVVGVTAFARGQEEGGGSVDGNEGAWQESGEDDRLHPGFRRVRSGSGFLLTADGTILTTADAVAGPADGVAEVVDVELAGGEHLLARVVGTEPTINLAVIQLEIDALPRPPALRPVRIAAGNEVTIGHWLIALGRRWGAGSTFAVGTVSSAAERECYQEDLTATLIQASLRVPEEGHGGPLVTIAGDVVAMAVPPPHADLAAPAYLGRAFEYGLPIHLAMGIYRALKIQETRKSPWLGVAVLDLAAARRLGEGLSGAGKLPLTGVYIDQVYEPSPASDAGVTIGDCLVAIDGNRLFSVPDFQKWLYLSGIGTAVSLEIFRNGESLERVVTIEERPPSVVPR